jgi:lipid-binding SYLF domain-containing protein
VILALRAARGCGIFPPMKQIIVGLLLLGLAGSAIARDKADLDNSIRKLTSRFEAMQAKPDKAIPAETLRKAQGVILLDRTKAGFIFAFQGGGGVALVKEPKGEKWSPAAFVSATEASLGFQIGGQQTFVVILLMNTNAARILTDSDIEFGGEASGTAGDTSGGVEGKVSTTERSVLVYDDRNGLYGGAAIKGGSLSPDDKANQSYYGQYVTMEDILFNRKVKQSETASALVEKFNQLSKK